MSLRLADRLRSVCCTTNVVVLEVGSCVSGLRAGGMPMVPGRPIPCSVLDLETAPGTHYGAVAGTEYHDEPTGLRVLCTRSGIGSVSVDGRPLVAVDRRGALVGHGVGFGPELGAGRYWSDR